MKAKQPEKTPLPVVNFLPFFSHTDLLAYTPDPLRLRLSFSLLLNKITFFFAPNVFFNQKSFVFVNRKRRLRVVTGSWLVAYTLQSWQKVSCGKCVFFSVWGRSSREKVNVRKFGKLWLRDNYSSIPERWAKRPLGTCKFCLAPWAPPGPPVPSFQVRKKLR